MALPYNIFPAPLPYTKALSKSYLQSRPLSNSFFRHAAVIDVASNIYIACHVLKRCGRGIAKVSDNIDRKDLLEAIIIKICLHRRTSKAEEANDSERLVRLQLGCSKR